MYVKVLPECMRAYHLYAWCPQRQVEVIGSPGTRVTDGCELPWGYWELNLYPVEEQLALLVTEPCLPAPVLPFDWAVYLIPVREALLFLSHQPHSLCAFLPFL